MDKVRSIFLTGVTGALGKEIIQELLTTTDDRLFLLVRGTAKLSYEERLLKFLSSIGQAGAFGTRVFAFQGDITLPMLGLSSDDVEKLRVEITHFFHIAALTALNGTEDDCQRVNVGGTAHALALVQDLWKKGKLERFYYFSTAYVAGSRQTYHSYEDSLPENPAFANYYESTKNEAEQSVRKAMAEGLPATIFRPSIVVGDSVTGEVSEFNVIYPFIKMFAHGMLSKLPTRLDNAFNIVPVDFVVKASLAISKQDDSVGKTFHLVTKNPPPIKLLLELRDKEYPSIPPIEVYDPKNFKRETLGPNEQFVYDVLQPYLGYLNDDLTFDTKNTEKALEKTSLNFPNTDYEFLKTLVRYAVNAGYLMI